MPPVRCPACGRFLKQDLVASLTDRPTPCPGCGTDLLASMFAPESESVRPPDLPPETVRDDPLTDWDRGADVVDLDRWRTGRPPFPVDAAMVGGAALAGAVLGGVVNERRGRGMLLGAVAGAVVAATARQVWRLQE